MYFLSLTILFFEHVIFFLNCGCNNKSFALTDGSFFSFSFAEQKVQQRRLQAVVFKCALSAQLPLKGSDDVKASCVTGVLRLLLGSAVSAGHSDTSAVSWSPGPGDRCGCHTCSIRFFLSPQTPDNNPDVLLAKCNLRPRTMSSWPDLSCQKARIVRGSALKIKS